MKDEDLVPIFETGDGALLAVIESVLDAAGIPYTVQGGRALGLLPMSALPVTLGAHEGAARILVQGERAVEARALLASAASG